MLTFVASGNDQFTNGLSFPSCITNAVSVGAVYDDTLPETMNSGGCTETPVQDRVVCFSNSATSLDLLAPGAMITTDAIGGGTFRYVGTSFASPAAAAAGALLMQLNPSLTAAQVETALKATGVPRTDRSPVSRRHASIVEGGAEPDRRPGRRRPLRPQRQLSDREQPVTIQ